MHFPIPYIRRHAATCSIQTHAQTNPPWQQLPSWILSLLGDIALLFPSEAENHPVFKRKKNLFLYSLKIFQALALFKKKLFNCST